MNNLITNFQNPEFLVLFRWQIIGAIAMCTAALCSFFILVCLQGKHNTITWKRIGLIYMYLGINMFLFMGSAMINVYSEDVLTYMMRADSYIGSIVLLYHPILIASFYKKKRFTIGLKMFILTNLLLCSGALVLYSFRLIIMASGKGLSGVERSEFRTYTVQMFADQLVPGFVCVGLLCLILIALMYVKFYRKGAYLKIRYLHLLLIGLWPWVIASLADTFAIQTEIEFLIGIRYSFICLLLVASMLLPTLCVLWGFRRQLMEKNKAQEIYLESELAYIEQYKKSQEKTRAFRHDIKNNLSLLQYMLKDGKVEEATDFLEEMSGKMRGMSPQYITGDEMLDCIVAMKADKMSEMNINFNLDGVIDGGLHMKPLEICTIFANILDNAIEAAGKVEEAGKRWVSMTLKKSGQFWVINVGNSTDGQPDIDKIQAGGGYTSKDDKDHHGFGLFNIRQTVEKQDGILKLEVKEEAFSLTVMLPKAG